MNTLKSKKVFSFEDNNFNSGHVHEYKSKKGKETSIGISLEDIYASGEPVEVLEFLKDFADAIAAKYL